MREPSRRRRVVYGAALTVVLVAIGLTAVLVGTPRAEQTIPTLGPTIARDTFAVAGPLDGQRLSGDGDFRWHSGRDSWVVRGGETGPSIDEPDRALVSPPFGSVTVGVTVTQLRGGAGLIIGFRDNQNYVGIAAAPAFGTWAVSEVRDGKQRTLGNLGLSSVKDGDRITARWSDREVCAWVESIQHTAEQVCVSAARHVIGKVGITVAQDAAEVRFDNFVVTT